jgi:beta-glucanase (GH16 family)
MLKFISGLIKNIFGKKEQPKPTSPIVSWVENFKTLSISGPKFIGKWRPNDNWQDIAKGYYDFAGNSWNVNPNEVGAISPFSIRDDHLVITCARRNDRWEGGMLITDSRRVSFKYGYISAKIRFPKTANGMFPAFWLYAVHDESLVPYEKRGAELDIMEIPGKAGAYSKGAHLLNEDQVGSSVDLPLTKLNLENEWHTYAVDWQPTHIRFYLDEKFVGEVPKDKVSFFNVPMSIRLNYSMDAAWFPVKSDNTTPNSLEMHVKYVEVYDSRPNIT